MPNTLTNLVPAGYRALDVVSRELIGFIPSIQLDPSAEMISVDQTVYIPQAPTNTAGKDITPAMAFPAAAYQTIIAKAHTITKKRSYPFSWWNEERKSVDLGPGYLSINEGQIAQALRGLVNEMEVDCGTAAASGAGRATGTTAGTAPVQNDYAQAAKILDDNGAPRDRYAVINTTAGVALRTTANLFKVNEAGDQSLLRQGILGNLYGLNVRESAGIVSTAAGAMAAATTTAAVLSIGQTVLPLATAGTGVVVPGDIITLANDTNKYVVSAVSFAGANPAVGDTITIAQPGLRVAQASGARAITVFATSARNVAFSRNAILLSTRLPASIPGDIALDRQTITDPNSGISFELAAYPGYRMVTYEVAAVWGVTAIKPEHIAVMIG